MTVAVVVQLTVIDWLVALSVPTKPLNPGPSAGFAAP